MPTRLEVLLQSRKSAAAGCGTAAKAPARTTEPTTAPVPAHRVRLGFILPLPRQKTSRELLVDENSPKIVDIRAG
jgi:hypothetical protein